MSEQATATDLEAALSDRALTCEALERIKQQVYSDKEQYHVLERLAGRWEAQGRPARDRLVAQWVLGRHGDVVGHIRQSGLQLLLQARSRLALGHVARAQEAFAELLREGVEKHAAACGLIESAVAADDLKTARKEVDKLLKKREDRADAQHLSGLVLEREGLHLEARQAYGRAVELDPQHAPALFRLAYSHDLRGDDARALELYEACSRLKPTYVSCLLNMGVLLEDKNEFDLAMNCYRKVLDVQPNHARARLFLKDARASLEMYFDEDKARARDRENLILSIPVTDFELSVRSRNCLNKMNIRSLGDLVQKTEAELLSYKNFGETSLMEIKEILAKKGLKLGQGRIADGLGVNRPLIDNPLVTGSGEAAKVVIELDFSVRVRTALGSLRIETLGDLSSRTSRELLACKNFGQTSLDEVRQVLTRHGMSLADEPQ